MLSTWPPERRLQRLDDRDFQQLHRRGTGIPKGEGDLGRRPLHPCARSDVLYIKVNDLEVVLDIYDDGLRQEDTIYTACFDQLFLA